MSEIIASDHFPEIAENGGISRRLERLGLNEVLADSSKRREFFATLDNKSFTKALGYVDSLTRGIRNPSYEFEDGQLPGLETPPLKFKEELMNRTFEAVRNILNEEELGNDESLRLAGLTLAGSLNFIHPYEDGNGRTGRVLHYLVEYGTERGEQAVNEELYAVIGKTKIYETDSKGVALNNSPPPAMTRELGLLAAESFADYNEHGPRYKATLDVIAFLDVMQAKSIFKNRAEAKIISDSEDRLNANMETIPSGTIELRDMYTLYYERGSEVANRNPEDVPAGAKRVIAERMSKEEEDRLRYIAGVGN